ncbi:MAG: molybdate ABC transporter substrate-binding protein [Anaerolineaceae bacterium]|nr:molybdate ABC transporter substrate-binding protein [Anaerolineaceae bacterium]
MRLKFLSIVLLLVLLTSAACAPQATPAPTAAPTAVPVAATQAPAPTVAPTQVPQTATTAPTQPASPTQAAAAGQTLTVLAAASLTAPFQDLAKEFEAAHPGVNVAYSFAGSQALAQQLDQGAPADVFASASTSYMTAAVKSNRVDQTTVQTFAYNRLIVIYPIANPAGIKTLQDLAKPGLKLDLEAAAVPAGQYSITFLDKASKDPSFSPTFKDTVLKNVVSYEDNVKSVLTKVSLGEADAGIVYVSDDTGDVTSKLGQIVIPDSLNTIATYPIAPISDSKNPDMAKAFVALVMSSDGQAALAKYSFIPAVK